MRHSRYLTSAMAWRGARRPMNGGPSRLCSLFVRCAIYLLPEQNIKSSVSYRLRFVAEPALGIKLGRDEARTVSVSSSLLCQRAPGWGWQTRRDYSPTPHENSGSEAPYTPLCHKNRVSHGLHPYPVKIRILTVKLAHAAKIRPSYLQSHCHAIEDNAATSCNGCLHAVCCA